MSSEATRHVKHGIAWLVLMAVVVGMFVALFWSAVFFSVCIDDTGGGPVGDSVQGRLCGDWVDWPGMYGALLILASAVVGILVTALLLHLSRDRSRVGLIVLALLVPAALSTAAFSFVYYTPTRCSADKQAAYTAWEAQPRKERTAEPPYDCEE